MNFLNICLMSVGFLFITDFALAKPLEVEGVIHPSKTLTIKSLIEQQVGEVLVTCPKFVHKNIKVLADCHFAYKARKVGYNYELTELVVASTVGDMNRQILFRDLHLDSATMNLPSFGEPVVVSDFLLKVEPLSEQEIASITSATIGSSNEPLIVEPETVTEVMTEIVVEDIVKDIPPIEKVTTAEEVATIEEIVAVKKEAPIATAKHATVAEQIAEAIWWCFLFLSSCAVVLLFVQLMCLENDNNPAITDEVESNLEREHCFIGLLTPHDIKKAVKETRQIP